MIDNIIVFIMTNKLLAYNSLSWKSTFPKKENIVDYNVTTTDYQS